MRLSTWLALATLIPAARGQTLEHDGCRVELAPVGVVVTPPADGLLATYGPGVALERGGAEWFGVAYDTSAGRIEGVAEGRERDYAGRTPVRLIASAFTRRGGTTVARLGDLEIEHTFSFCDFTDRLVVGVVLRNVGSRRLDGVTYSREWRGPDLESGTFPPELSETLPPAAEHVWRVTFPSWRIEPGDSSACSLAFETRGGGLGPAAVDVPLRLWIGGPWIFGLDFGKTNGIAFGDYDHDGWIDVFACNSRNLWRNLGGRNWELAANLDSFFTPGSFEYSAAFGDFDNDTLPDLGTEPRGECMLLLHNLGDALFEEVAGDPAILDVQPCATASETLCIADTDGDANLDFFLPAYPWTGGNWFLWNEGPIGPNGETTFHEASGEAGLDNPPHTAQPEGAEFCDVDGDGDVDLYSNVTIYRNLSTPGTPLFEAMTSDGSGVLFPNRADEGAGFLDYDMDGDLDLCIAYCDTNLGVRMYENLGDGTFDLQPKKLFDAFDSGLCLGLSHADWDNDGDVDVTTSEVFRRNLWLEEGKRHFKVATHSIVGAHIGDATPAWGDFDRDGDVDSAIGNWGTSGHLYENTLHGSTTPDDARRYVRVRVVRDSTDHDEGLETEYGAQVTVRPLAGAADEFPRTKIVSSAGGYLNQDEYALPFGLPPDPDPADPDADLLFSVAVDFKGSADQRIVRVDRHVNPVLGEVSLAQLEDREIVVYRSGRVKLDGSDFRPSVPTVALGTTTHGLVRAPVDAPLAAPSPAPATDWFVGIELSTAGASGPLRLEELLLDGQLDAAVACSGTPANLFVWDVSDPSSPVLAAGGAVEAATSARNHRSALALDATLEPRRLYRVLARVTEWRATTIAAPVSTGPITTNGGLFFQDLSPCTGAGAVAAALDPASVCLAVRFRREPTGAWADLGQALAGSNGVPRLDGSGNLRAGETTSLSLTGARANAPLFLVGGLEADYLPLFGGVLVPSLDLILSGLATDATGAFTLTAPWPPGLPHGANLYFQTLIEDSAAPRGVAFSNAVVANAPF